MTELGNRANAGKSRPDLIPWNEFYPIAIDHGVEATMEGLKIWWSAAPLTLQLGIPQRQLRGIAEVLAFGAQKYADRNWEKGLKYSCCFDSAERHARDVANGVLVNDESGLANESHFWTNVLFLVVFAERGRTDLDDRPAPVASVVARMEKLKTMVDLLNGVPPEPTTKDN